MENGVCSFKKLLKPHSKGGVLLNFGSRIVDRMLTKVAMSEIIKIEMVSVSVAFIVSFGFDWKSNACVETLFIVLLWRVYSIVGVFLLFGY